MSTFWHLARWEERPGSRATSAAASRGQRRSSIPRPRRPTGSSSSSGRSPRAPRPGPLTVALTHDIDTPCDGAGPRRCRGRGAGQGAAVARRPRTWCASCADSRGFPATEPVAPTELVLRRIAEIERSHGGFSTYFVLAGHHHPADGAAPRVYERVRPAVVDPGAGAGRRAGPAPELHGLGGRRADRGGAIPPRGAGGRPGARRPLPLPAPRRPHDAAGARPAGVRLRLEPGLRRPPGCGPACRIRTGRTTWRRIGRSMLELPLVVMDATLAEDRYLGLSAMTTASTARSRRFWGRLGPAARSRSSGTTTASTPPMRAAGIGRTTGCFGGCASAAGGSARPPRPSGSRPVLRRVGEARRAAVAALDHVDPAPPPRPA